MASRTDTTPDLEALVATLDRLLDDAFAAVDRGLEGRASLAELREALRVIRRIAPRFGPAPSEDEMRSSMPVAIPNPEPAVSREPPRDPGPARR